MTLYTRLGVWGIRRNLTMPIRPIPTDPTDQTDNRGEVPGGGPPRVQSPHHAPNPAAPVRRRALRGRSGRRAGPVRGRPRVPGSRGSAAAGLRRRSQGSPDQLCPAGRRPGRPPAACALRAAAGVGHLLLAGADRPRLAGPARAARRARSGEADRGAGTTGVGDLEEIGEVFREKDGQPVPPAPWDAPEALPAACQGAAKLLVRDEKVADLLDSTVQPTYADGTLPGTLTDQSGHRVRFEIR